MSFRLVLFMPHLLQMAYSPRLQNCMWLYLTFLLLNRSYPLSRSTWFTGKIDLFGLQFLSTSIWPHYGLSLCIGSSRYHKLIADCLDFLDVEAKVNTLKLGPNSLFYLPSLFHFLENKGKNSTGPVKDD